MTVCCTQCPPTKVTLCLTPSFVWIWLALILQSFPMKILTERGNSCTATAERETVWDVQEELCYIAVDYDTVLISTAESSDKRHTHMLSDGNIITVAPNVSVARVFFQPSVIGKEASGVHDTSSRVDIHKNLYANVAPSGTTCSKGLWSA